MSDPQPISAGALLRLASLVFAAVTCIVVGDTAGKLLTAQGAAPPFVAWTRFALAAMVLLPFSGFQMHELRYLRDWRVLARAGFIIGGITCILTALKTEPIANVFGAFFIGPVVSYVLSMIVLGERPSRLRALLLALGFAGVMLVVKPGFGMSIGLLFGLAAGTFYGAYLMMTRMTAGNYRPRFLLISQLLIGGVVLAPVGLSAPLPDLSAWVALMIVISALGSAAGNFMLVVASQRAQASLIAPLVYSQLISATALGIWVFGDWPDTLSLIGLAVIGLSGLGSLWANQRESAPK